MKKKIVFLPYDFDTAIGINNEGSLAFPYNLEDTDTVGNADVYNGQQSVLWNNLRDSFGSELKTMYQNLRSSGALSYDKIETMFEEHQEKWPAAIFNEDAKYKYEDPLADQGDESYLSMLQGSKEAQRKWWLYNRFKYLDSKYNAGDSLTDVITIRAYAKNDITITPYADIYASIKYGSSLISERAPRNVPIVLDCPLDNLNDTEIYIYSASRLTDIGDLSGLKMGYGNFSYATKLQTLKIGDADSQYDNTNLVNLYLGNNTLLKTLDVRNCSGLGTGTQKTVDLSQCSNIENVYFEGTNILGVSLPNGGMLKKLHLPGTITNLVLSNQTNLTELVCSDYSHITTFSVTNPSNAINIRNIMMQLPTNARIRLFNFDWEAPNYSSISSFFEYISQMRGLDQDNSTTLDKPVVYGKLRIGTINGEDLLYLQQNFPDITIIYNSLTTYCYYYDYYGETLLYRETLSQHQNGVYSGIPSKPTNTPACTFGNFQGWSLQKESDTADINARKDITTPRIVYAAWQRTIRAYSITFKLSQSDGGTILLTLTVPYGEMPVYTGETPTSSETDFVFSGEWDPPLALVTEDKTYTAIFEDHGLNLYKYLRGNIETYTSNINYIRPYGFYNQKQLKTVECQQLSSIGSYGFYGSAIQEFTAPQLQEIGSYCFYSCDNLTTFETPASNIQGWAFGNDANLKTIRFTSFNQIVFGTRCFDRTPIKDFIIENSTTVPLLDDNTFYSNVINTFFYVPNDMVNSYKNDTKWCFLKSRILPLDAYPFTGNNTDTISDDWATIVTKINNNTANYQIGDIKTIICGENGEYEMQYELIGFDEYTITGTQNTAKTVWYPTLCTPIKKCIHEREETVYSYDQTTIRQWLNEDFFNSFPSSLKQGIKNVDVEHTNSGSQAITTSEKIFLPSWTFFHNRLYLGYRFYFENNSSLVYIPTNYMPVNNTIRVYRHSGVYTTYNVSSSLNIFPVFCI